MITESEKKAWNIISFVEFPKKWRKSFGAHSVNDQLIVETAIDIKCRVERAVGVHRAWSNFHSFKWSLLKYPLPDCPSSQVTVSRLWVVVGETKYLRYRRQEVHFSSWSEDVEALTDALSLCYRGSWRSFASLKGDSSISFSLLIITSSRTCIDSLILSPSFIFKHTLFRIHLAATLVPLMHPSYVNMVTFAIWLIAHKVTGTWSCSSCHLFDASYIGWELGHNICLRSARFLKSYISIKKISC